jgi:hypothetical protein
MRGVGKIAVTEDVNVAVTIEVGYCDIMRFPV